MKFGAQVSAYRTSWDDIRSVVETMDAGRWSSVWFADHFVPPNRPRDQEPLPAYEAMALAGAAASITETLRIGHLVLGNTYRNPAHVAKIAGSIDHISHGRFVLGIGASWFQREHEAYGWNFPSMKERQDRFQEAMQLLRALIHAEEPVDFQGRYYSLDDAPLSPGSYDAPIPLLVGGTGEKRTLRTLAMYGDVLNLDGWAGKGVSAELLRHKLDVVEKHCADVGRDPAEITPTVLVPVRLTDDPASAERFIAAIGPNTVAGPADYVVQRVGELIDTGAQEIMFGVLYNTPDDFQRIDEEVIAAFD